METKIPTQTQMNGIDVFVKEEYVDKQRKNLMEKMKKQNLILSLKGEEARSGKVFNVLLVEDNMTDAEYIRKSLMQTNANFELVVLNKGQEALKYINRQSPYAKLPIPDLIVLDLHLPDEDGKEILSYIKGQKHLSWIPLIAISDAQDIRDEQFAHEQKVDTYLKKPFKIADFYNAFISANKFWFMMENLSMAK